MTAEPFHDEESALPLRERKKLRTRRVLADTALRMFLERGFDQTTLDDLVATAEVSVRTFFRYYSSKEEVALAAEGELWEAYAAEVERMSVTGPVLPLLRDCYANAVRGLPGDWTERYLATRKLVARNPVLNAHHAGSVQALRVRLTELLEEETGTDSRADVRLRLVSEMALAAVRYGSMNWVRAYRHSDRTGDAATLLAEVTAAFDALPCALTLSPDTLAPFD
ncbi:TetR family transcriptional regulator [Nocardiopsis dassonvillei]|uniref:Transcriptional regulator, TetR family n=1 Tax=Nocardiopsis dassonvillei (strain ATCC 23218 / DSM 43111 / CIP 107115 / JCM 7437 / KCTC 9190 / NBRC 14626 / NCTC 10488 / NRRL B-5397 / IMRU 509) TaxID=446468 RepID=D7B1X5_NOCDD|nr:TetR family transcriptional regulator [Nocardiopsis dassonvillei]ADH66596.1 transcriptional regulator, TetR family [Nocardiopsis dassonvillei subsp. dassonvillei DSM 43111]NKY78982.1 TetR family transcriptional regulator [Nocardiopsis dassonvillei]VEI92618.1 mycofactocin system transcriptional regulator [Nocardiopsis dassonvillei]